MTLNIEKGSITTPAGFRASGVYCGLKEKDNDLALVISDRPAVVAGMFTTNQIKAAPILLSQRRIKNASARGIVVNSGNANACTGEQGFRDAEVMTKIAANELGLETKDILVASTGVIGEFLPMEKLQKGILEACRVLSYSGGTDAARAIMTTDTVPKHFSTSFELEGRTCSIGVIAKGSGMIQPHLATMICIFTTDVAIEKQLLQQALEQAVDVSLNSLSIDGEMSTNDCVFILANGASGNTKIVKENASYATFLGALEQLAVTVARALAADGEGATKLVTVTVEGADTREDARMAARAVANSMLVKTAIYGEDPNWGRVFSAVGATKVKMLADAISVNFAGIPVAEKGRAIPFDADTLKKALHEKEIEITINLGIGQEASTVFTCDLTYEYIAINAEYHT